ncbi:MAG TPA: aspartyl protease family protein [Blastocatellia bacterium]|nr:aspartyl protease family protein [Blastocatellia bacterium]
MKVKGIESALSGFRLEKNSRLQSANDRSTLRVVILFVVVLSAFLFAVAPSRAVVFADDTEDEAREKIHREARKAIRKGKYERAVELYNDLINKRGQDLQARLGASFAYLKQQNYDLSFEQAAEVLKLDVNNARAHALAGVALLRSGFVRPAIAELQQSLNLNPKEALAIGGAAEVDYFEGRSRESLAKAIYAHRLDPDEPDYIMTYARASSRVEDFKEAADAYELFLEVAPESDKERRDRIRGLIRFYRQLSGLRVHDISGPASTGLPFHLGSDRRPYIKLKVNNRDATFVIDTGSGFTVISADAAKRLGVSEISRGGNSQGVGGTGKFEIIYGLIKSLNLGGMKVKQIPCFIRHFHGTENRPTEERADGFIGLSILSHFITELDYKENRMNLDRNLVQPLLAVNSPGATVIPFRTTQNGLISIETEFDETKLINVILDSGASSTAISVSAVERLKMRDQIIKGQTANVIGAAGVTNNVELLFIRNCRVADLLQNNLRALVLDFGAINETSGFEQSGILGGDFLRHFRVTIDFPRTQVLFQPHTSAVTKQ